MVAFVKSRRNAFLCVLALVVCTVAIHPQAEIGMYDDWSYVRTAQVLAQTGHIVYNGWGAVMLGWYLYPAALLVKVFGFSFTTVRSATMIEAMLAAFLMQRMFVRVGLIECNAMLGTLALVLSPLFLPLMYSFMTDMSGFLAIVVCLYSCIRALQAERARAAILWLCFASVTSAVGGTSRQLAWLGVLMMVPCTVWILRKRQGVVAAATPVFLVNVVFIFATLRWYNHQSYSVPEALIPKHVGATEIVQLVTQFIKLNLEGVLLLLPVMLLFVPAIRRRSRVAQVMVVGGSIVALALLLLVFVHLNREGKGLGWLAPFLANGGTYLNVSGLYAVWPAHGDKPVILGTALRLMLTGATLLGLFALMAFCVGEWRGAKADAARVYVPTSGVSWAHLCLLVLPFVAGYYALFMPRAATRWVFDRYLVPIMMFAILFMLKVYQERVRERLPLSAVALIGLYGVFAVAGTHDGFAMYRASSAAIEEMRAKGVPATQIDGGWEYNGLTEVDQKGYVNEADILDFQHLHVDVPTDTGPAECAILVGNLFPGVEGRYALALKPDMCGGPAGFAPVTYTSWLGPHKMTIYIVRRKS
jgi:hypothetical protein